MFQQGPQILYDVHIWTLRSPWKKNDPRMIIKPLLDFLGCVTWRPILHEDGATSLPEWPAEILVKDINVDILVDSLLAFRTLLAAAMIAVIFIRNDNNCKNISWNKKWDFINLKFVRSFVCNSAISEAIFMFNPIFVAWKKIRFLSREYGSVLHLF